MIKSDISWGDSKRQNHRKKKRGGVAEMRAVMWRKDD